MTVICYDGVIMAADRRSTKKQQDGTRVTVSLEREKISIDFDTAVYNGEPIIAVGRAGRIAVSTALVDILRQSGDLFGKEASVSKKIQAQFGITNVPRAALLIMTKKHTHEFRVNGSGVVVVTTRPRKVKVAIGSGSKKALTVMECLGLPAKAACAMMELHDESCGGGVTYTSRKRRSEGKPNGQLNFADQDALKKYVVEQNIRSSERTLLTLKKN